MSEIPSTSVVPMGSGELTTTLPSKLMVTRGPGTFEIAWRWRDQVPRSVAFGSLFPLLIMLPNFMNTLTRFPVFGACMLAFIAATYGGFALAWAKNTFRIRVDRGVLELRSGPVSLRRGAREVDDVVRFEIEPAPRQGRVPRFGVVAIRTYGDRTRLVGPMLEEAQAKAVVQLLDEALAEGRAPRQ